MDSRKSTIRGSYFLGEKHVFSVCSISTWNFTSGNNALVRKWAQNPLLHHHVLQIAMILGLFFPCWTCLARPRPQGCRSGPANSPLWLGRSSANLAECCQGWGGSAQERWEAFLRRYQSRPSRQVVQGFLSPGERKQVASDLRQVEKQELYP